MPTDSPCLVDEGTVLYRMCIIYTEDYTKQTILENRCRDEPHASRQELKEANNNSSTFTVHSFTFAHGQYGQPNHTLV